MHKRPGRDLGYTRYDKMAEVLGCYVEYVEEREDIRPALERAWKKVEKSMVGFLNAKTDYRDRGTTARFSSRETRWTTLPSPRRRPQAGEGREEAAEGAPPGARSRLMRACR